MIILLSGDDTFRSRQRLNQLRLAFTAKFDPTSLNTINLDGATMNAGQFDELSAAQGFLATKRFLVVTNLIHDGKPAVQEAVLASLHERSATTENIIVFREVGSLEIKKSGTAFAKPALALIEFFRQHAKHEVFFSLEPAAVERWILKETELRGGTIEKKAVSLLAAAVDSDLWRADRELEKLVRYRQGQLITVDDVEQMLSIPVEDTVFRLTDALGQRDVATAIRLLEDQFQQGVDPLALLRTIAWHVRTVVTLRSILDQGQTLRNATKTLKLHPFVIQKASKQAEYFTMAELIAIHDELVMIDTKVKSTSVDPKLLFDLLVLAFSPPGRLPEGRRKPVRTLPLAAR